MKKTIALLFLTAAIVTPAFAGEGESCDHEAQVCLNYMAQHLEGRGWAGVDLDESGEAITVTAVFDGTPAEKAGVKIGDQLVAVNGIRISEENEEKVHALMGEMTPGKTFDYTLSRNGRERNISIMLAEMPDEAKYKIIGRHMLQGHSTVEVASNN
jgi:predicted metalloprotease with PDZ domain